MLLRLMLMIMEEVVLNVGSLDDVVRAAMTVSKKNFKLLVRSLLLSFFLSRRQGRSGLIYIFRALRPNYDYYDVESLA